MLRLERKFLIQGMQIAQSIVTPSGQIFLEQGTILKIEYIKKFVQWGIPRVNVVLPAKFDHSKLHFLMPHWETVELVATAFETVRIFKEVPIAECKELVEFYIELMIDVIGAVHHLSQLRAHNPYTFRHSLNVAIISGLIGKWLGYTGETLKDLILAGLFHDIGKILIPLEILNKSGKLTAKEMDVVKKHSSHGYDFVKGLKETSDEVKISILQNHERLDGSGYPFGLFKDKISVFARIIAIADVYDAMTSERVYRRKLSPFSAVETIVGDMYDKLDPDICIIFLARIQDYLTSSSVLLNNGQDASHSISEQSFSRRSVIKSKKGDELLDREGYQHN